MESPSTSLLLFLLANQLVFCPTDADQEVSTVQPYFDKTKDHSNGSTSAVELHLTTIDHTTSPEPDTTDAGGNCLIDTEMSLIAIGSAGGLIVCLLVAIAVLAYQVYSIQRQFYIPQISCPNMDLVSNAGYWDTEQPEVGGLVGPCEDSVMLEEVRAGSKIEEDKQAEIQHTREEAVCVLEEGAMAMAFDSEEKAGHIPSSSSRDYFLEVSKDLEDMALVV